MQKTLGLVAALLVTSSAQAQELHGATREFGYKVRVDGNIAYEHIDPGPSSPRDFRPLKLPEAVSARWRCTASIWFVDLNDDTYRTTYQEVVCKSRAGKPTQTLVTRCRHDIEASNESDMKLELEGHEVTIIGRCRTVVPKNALWGFGPIDWKWDDDADDDDSPNDDSDS